MEVRDARARIDEIWADSDAENRELTWQERREVDGLLGQIAEKKQAHHANATLDGAGGGWERGGGSGLALGNGPGDVFIRSAGYKSIRDPSARTQKFSSGLIEVSDYPLSTKGTLTESGVGGPGGGLVPPAYQPGIVSKLFEELSVQDVFGQSPTSASQMRYIVEGTATSGSGRGRRGRVEARERVRLLRGH